MCLTCTFCLETLNVAYGIIFNFSIIAIQGWSFAFAYYNPLMITLVLMDRENDDSKECKKKYGDDWDTYCHRVKYRLIPGIY